VQPHLFRGFLLYKGLFILDPGFTTYYRDTGVLVTEMEEKQGPGIPISSCRMIFRNVPLK
jgi:hypothetical protein